MSIIERIELAYQAISPRFGAQLTEAVLLDVNDHEVDALQQLAAERGVVVARKLSNLDHCRLSECL